MFEIFVFVLAMALAQATAGIIMLMIVVSKWYAKKVTKMSMDMTKNLMEEMKDIYE